MTFGTAMVQIMNGIAFFNASFHLPVLPHIEPKDANKKPEIPIVGWLTYIGSRLATEATAREVTGFISFFICQSTRRFTAR